MALTLKTIREAVVAEVTPEQVKAASQKDYNQSAWNNAVERFAKYEGCKFYTMPGKIYEFDFYAVYIADGIRFLNEVSYSSSLSSGGFAFGWMDKVKDSECLFTMKVMSYVEGRIGNDTQAREYMKQETSRTAFGNKFFTKIF